MQVKVRSLALLVLALVVPGLLHMSPAAQLVPGPFRLFLGLLWLTAPMGAFLWRRVETEHNWPFLTRWSVIILLGWCVAGIITLLVSAVNGSWLLLGILLGLGNLICAWSVLRGTARPGKTGVSPSGQPLRYLLMACVAAALAYLLRMGGFMAQDGSYHLAYLSALLERAGPGQVHPLLDSTEFDPRYPLSTYHCLLAFLSLFSRVSHLDVWFYTPAFLLPIAAGVWRLYGNRLFQSSVVGDLCAIFFLLLSLVGGSQGGGGFRELRTLVYPGGFSLHVLLPALIAFSWNASVQRPLSIFPVALVAVALATTHLFYFVLGTLILSAGLAGLGLLIRGGGRARAMVVSVPVVILVASPMLLWVGSRYQGVQNPVFTFDPQSKAPHDYKRHLFRTSDKTFILHPKTWLGLTGLNAYPANASAVSLVCLVIFWRRMDPEVRAFLGGVMAIVIGLVSIPPLFTWLTQTITLYKSFRLFQALPVIPLLAFGAFSLSEWAILIRRKVTTGRCALSWGGWAYIFACAGIFLVCVPNALSLAARVHRDWSSVHSWWREPRRDVDRVRFQAFQRIAAMGYRGTIIADPYDALAYGGLFGGKVIAIPDFHAPPTSRDIRERLRTVDAIRSGWFSCKELSEVLDLYQVGQVFFRWSNLSPLGQATLAACLQQEIVLAEGRNRREPGNGILSEDDLRSAYVVFHAGESSLPADESVFVDLQVVDGETYRLRRDGTIWDAAGKIIASVTPVLAEDAAERFKHWQGKWIVATRSGRLIQPSGQEIPLHQWRQAPGRANERPVALILSQDMRDVLVVGSRGSWGSTSSAQATQFSNTPVWRTETLRAAFRDIRGGILLLNAFGGVHTLGKVLALPEERPDWMVGATRLDMATGIALDPSATSLYLLTRTGRIYVLSPDQRLNSFSVSKDAGESVWLSLAADKDSLLAMDHRGNVFRLDLSSLE